MQPIDVHRRVTIIACAVCAIATACGGDGPTGDPLPKPTRLILVTEPPAVAETMVPLGTQPTVQAADASGRAAPAATTVTATVLNGSGAVVGGASVATDAGGRAAFSSLTLGGTNGAVGPLTLQFSAPGLAPVTAQIELRCAVRPISIGQTISGQLTSGDCAFSPSGRVYSLFEVMTSQPVTAVRLTQDGPSGALVEVRGPNSPAYHWGWGANSGSRVSYTALLPPGPNRVAITSIYPGQLGSYSLAIAATSEDLSCESLEAWAASPITTVQQLGAGDCSGASGFEDGLMVGLAPNASITVSMTSGLPPQITLADGLTGAVVAQAVDPLEQAPHPAPSLFSASLTFANGSTAKPYHLKLASTTAGSSGRYTLSLNITYPSSSAVAAAALTPQLPAPVVRQGSALSPVSPRPFVPAWSRSWP